MSRSGRQMKLIEIIKHQDIDTQEGLADALRKEGFVVTQATISRDISDLGLIKVLTDGKHYKYARPPSDEQRNSGKMLNLFRDSVTSMDHSGNLIVMRTVTGGAATAASLIDKLNFRDIMGCIAGDDTVLVIVKETGRVPEILMKFRSLLS